MNWYVAKMIFGISTENKGLNQFDEQLRLIEAYNTEEAFLKARMIGLSEEDSFLNDHKKTVKWEFINIVELIQLPKLEDGVELISRIYEMEEGHSHVNFIHRRAVSLRLSYSSTLSN